jgi:hypothetical protein
MAAGDKTGEVEQGLRLMRAFRRISDAVARHALIVIAEKLARRDRQPTGKGPLPLVRRKRRQ